MPADPIRAVVHPDPYPYYRRLARDHPVHLHDGLGLWVVAGDAALDALTDERLRVRPTPDRAPAALVGALARTTDGGLHDALRAATVGLLSELAPLDLTAMAAVTTTAMLDAAPLTAQRLDTIVATAPVATLADALGAPSAVPHVAAVARGIGAAAMAADHRDALEAADALLAAGLDWPTIGVLVQTLEATAGLAGNSLVALARGRSSSGTAALVAATATEDPAVHNTRRWAAAPVELHGRAIPAGAPVLLVLASAGAPFGGGAHQCPGEQIAHRVAVGVVDALRDPVAPLAAALAAPRYRPRPNVRIPTFAAW